MKNVYKILPLLLISLSLVFVSCQEEEQIIINPTVEESIVANSELANLIMKVSADDLDVNGLKDVNFVYPISFAKYNTAFQFIETVSVVNDLQLHNYIMYLNSNHNTIISSLTYPVNLTYKDSSQKQIANNSELITGIQYSYGFTFNPNDVISNITECTWKVEELIDYQGNNVTSSYSNLEFTFYANEFVIIKDGINYKYGSLEVHDISANETSAIMHIFNFSGEINDYYKVSYSSDEQIVLLSNGTTKKLVLKRVCNTVTSDPTVTQIRSWLDSGNWNVSYFVNNNINETASLSGINFDFQLNTDMIASNYPTQPMHWQVVKDVNNQYRMVIDYLGHLPNAYMDDDWYITSYNSTTIELHHVNDSSNSQYVLVFQKQ